MDLARKAKLFIASNVGLDVGISDEDLMVFVKEGKTEVFGMLYERYKKPLWTFIVRRVKHEEHALELSHDIFIKVMHQAQSFDGPKFAPWFWRIAHNRLIDFYRKKDVELFEDQGDDVMIEHVPDESSDPLSKIVLKDEMGFLEDCLSKLKENQRHVLLLRLMSEESYDSIAKITGENLQVIKNWIHRARVLLAKCLKDHGVTSEE